MVKKILLYRGPNRPKPPKTGDYEQISHITGELQLVDTIGSLVQPSCLVRDLPHTLFGGLASNAAPRRYNLRIVTDIAIVGPRTLVTAGA